MEEANNAKSIQIRPLGGVNQKLSPIDLPPSDFAECKGLFPSQIGKLERFSGTKYLTRLSEAILSITPTYNSQGHILIQTATKRYATTLDELFDRNEYETDLTPTTSVPGEELEEEEDMAMAIVIGRKSAGTAGKVITTTLTARDLSDIVLNEGGIIVSAIVADVFDISAGTYRIEFWACCSGNKTGATPTQFISKMWNETNNTNLYFVGGVVSAATSDFPASTPVRGIDTSHNHMMHHIGQVTLDSTCSVSLKSKSADNDASIIEGKPSNLGQDEVYTVIKILKVA